jgi:hypothetical protein
MNEKDPIDFSLTKTTTTTTLYPDGRVDKSSYLELIESDMDINASFFESGSSDSSLGNQRYFYNLIRKKYEDDYALSPGQFDLIKGCFEKLDKRDEYISTFVFRHYILDQVRERADSTMTTQADETAVERAIAAVDTDADGDIDFNEYLDFLYLFFAKRQNVRRRIVSVLNGRSFSHTRKGELTETEQACFFLFLKNFYGARAEEQLSKLTAVIASGAAKKGSLTYKEFANLVYPILKERLFVK